MRNVSAVVVLALVLAVASGVLAEEKKGGAVPCLVTCCIGPRVGLEMNEDKSIQGWEFIHAFGGYIPYVGFLARPVASWKLGGEKNGAEGCLCSYCFGPRVGAQLHERKVRTKEWTRIIPIYGIIPAVQIALEAYNGKTMIEIVEQEDLSKEVAEE